MPITTFVLTAPGILALLVISFLAWRREKGVIRDHLRDEVARGVLTPGGVRAAAVVARAGPCELATWRQRGLRAFFAQRDLHQAATELAFRKWHLSRGEKPKRGAAPPAGRSVPQRDRGASDAPA